MMRNFSRLAVFVFGLLAVPAIAQTIPGGGGSGSAGPCSAFGTTTGTCLQGAGALGTPSSGSATNLTATTPAATDNSTKLATTAYVTTGIANAIAAVNPAVAVQAATTLASDTSGYTYLNGVGGIGATLTGVVNTALTVDGFTFTAAGQRLLVKNDTQAPSGAFNGIYNVTQIQTGILPVILTRALDYDQPSDINNTGAIPVINGTVNGTTQWIITSTVNTVGTDPATFTKFSSNPSAGVSLTIGSGSNNLTAPFQIFVCTSTCSITPPTPAAGVQFCIENDATVSTVITMVGVTSVFYQKAVAAGTANGYGSSAGTMTSGGAVGDMVCLIGRDATHYLVGAFGGTWTNT